jgi:hypothetical protein
VILAPGQQTGVRRVLVLLLQQNGLCLRSVNPPHPTAKRRPDAERAVYIAALIASRTYPSAIRLYANTIIDPNLPSFLFFVAVELPPRDAQNRHPRYLSKPSAYRGGPGASPRHAPLRRSRRMRGKGAPLLQRDR